MTNKSRKRMLAQQKRRNRIAQMRNQQKNLKTRMKTKSTSPLQMVNEFTAQVGEMLKFREEMRAKLMTGLKAAQKEYDAHPTAEIQRYVQGWTELQEKFQKFDDSVRTLMLVAGKANDLTDNLSRMTFIVDHAQELTEVQTDLVEFAAYASDYIHKLKNKINPTATDLDASNPEKITYETDEETSIEPEPLAVLAGHA